MASACRPATPTPSTSTVAGFTVPAAVVSIGKNRVDSDAATNTALYPATLACDDNASITCAREIRGIASSAKPLTPASRRPSATSGCVRGARNPTTRGFRLQQTDLVGGRRVHLHHEVGRPGVTDRRSGLFVLCVGDQCPCAGTGFDDDVEAGGLQSFDDLGDQRDTAFACSGLSRHSDQRHGIRAACIPLALAGGCDTVSPYLCWGPP